MSEIQIDMPVRLTRRGANAWHAEVDWKGMLICAVPVNGESENEVLWEISRWMKENQKNFDDLRAVLEKNDQLHSYCVWMAQGYAQLRLRNW